MLLKMMVALDTFTCYIKDYVNFKQHSTTYLYSD